MEPYQELSFEELNRRALHEFIYQPVSRDMIKYLAKAASNVIQCDPNMAPPSTTRFSSSGKPVPASDGLPSVEDFITKLVISSNVQVPTLMSTLVYLTRLKQRLQPEAKGLRCTIHRIFLATLIIAAKYLNDSSPKNKHWANYTVMQSPHYHFGFTRQEVNLMERQLLALLSFDLRITEEDLYQEFEPFLAPLREKIATHRRERYERKLRQQQYLQEQQMRIQQQRHQNDEFLTVPVQPSLSPEHTYPTPPSSRGSSCTRSPYHSRNPSSVSGHSRSSSRSVTPPDLVSSGASSYAPSVASRATTPCEDEPAPEIQVVDSPEQVSDLHCEDVAPPKVPAKDYYNSTYKPAAYQGYGAGYNYPAYPQATVTATGKRKAAGGMLPYEISAEQAGRMYGYQPTQWPLRGPREDGKVKKARGMWERVLGAVSAVGGR
ncbi:G1/S-specific cyclin pcl1 (cyclin hcs26)-like protein [Thermochaetoides thermophila DSM 1495]|uniref:G1/S-specific cyclin pcl1 (Cyclin hcs26)-like protein n=1 Tax=Chaetomium thermophilum (strain DSM 1495 / CBS 144.50 / IMI 039719) TaxID=759272 RepID=G0SAC7_CHATD|nr:G1/S-specific cyclin pcl1 (cyclin hcs26)-like protein [Thermochaetoides thermophila DSM 1495]EGS19699.1 G1/S-specific cyclin pcl1 (cyclin hcs26)-like protein [Thermochaetoides thermophila DSM 1495]